MAERKALHLIGRVVLDLEFASEALARDWQAHASETWAQLLEPLLTELLDQYTHSPHLVRIDRIDLRLEHLTEENFQAEFPRAVGRAMRQWLAEHPLPPLEAGDGSRSAGPEGNAIRHLPQSQAWAEFLSFFLAHGFAPSWQSSEASSPEQALRYLLQQDPTTLRALLAALPQPAQTARRIQTRFALGLRQRLFKALAGPAAASLISLRRDLVRAWTHMASPAASAVQAEALVEEGLFTLIMRDLPAPPSRERIVRALPAFLAQRMPLPAQRAVLAEVLEATRRQGPRKYAALRLSPAAESLLEADRPDLAQPEWRGAADSPDLAQPQTPVAPQTPGFSGAEAPFPDESRLPTDSPPPPEPGLTTRLDHFQAWLAQGQAPWWSGWTSSVLPPPAQAFEDLWATAPEAVRSRLLDLLQAEARQNRRSPLPFRWHALLGPLPVQVLLPSLAPALAPVLPGLVALVQGIRTQPEVQPYLRADFTADSPAEVALLAGFLLPDHQGLSLQVVLPQIVDWLAAGPAQVLPLLRGSYGWLRQASSRDARLRPFPALLASHLRAAEATGDAIPPRADQPPALASDISAPPPQREIPVIRQEPGSDPPFEPEPGPEPEPRTEPSPEPLAKPPEAREPETDLSPTPEAEPLAEEPETGAESPTLRPPTREQSVPPPDPDYPSSLPEEAIAAGAEGDYLAQLAADPPQRQRLLQHLATHGSLPPEAQLLSQTGLSQLIAAMVAQDPLGSGRWLGRLIRQAPARHHLGRLLEAAPFRAWVATLPALTGSDLLPYVALLDHLMPEASTDRVWRQQALLAYLSRHEGRSPDPFSWLDWVLRQAARVDQVTPLQRLARWQTLAQGLPEQVRPAGLADILVVLERSLAQRPVSQRPAEAEPPATPASEEAARETPARKRQPLPGDMAIFVPNAGIVLAWPFLPHFFQQSGLLRPDRKFVDEAAAQRAIHLVQYLVDKRTDTPEEKLVLNKVLCGWPVNEPVVAAIEALPAEIDMAEALIEAARQRWGPLKNASNDGFRGSFFIREGRLSASANGNWKLVVAQRPFDLLLDQLPWNLSMIRLPWMQGLLAVEWR